LGVIGQTIRVNGYPIVIIGVAQRGFDGMEPGVPASIFVALNVAPSVRPGFKDMLNRRHRWVNVYGRLKPGASIEQARAGLQPLFHQILESEVTDQAFRNATAFDKEQFLKMRLNVLPGSQGNSTLRRQYERPLWVVMGVVVLVLLIACANVASLLTARAASRRKEIAIRLAIGCSRTRVIQQLLVESVILSSAGAVAGICLAVLMGNGLLTFLPTNVVPYAISASPDLSALGFTLGLSLLTGIGFGVVPAFQCSKPDVAPTLKDQVGRLGGGGAPFRFRKITVAIQVALCLFVLIGASLFLRSLSNLRSIDPGFRTTNLLRFSVAPRSAGYDVAGTVAFYQRLAGRLEELPGVRSAAYASMAVLTATGYDLPITVEGYRSARGELMKPHFDSVSPGYFETMGMQVLAGRKFTSRDDASAPRTAIVNASFVRKYFENGLAVGRHIGIGSDPGTPTDIEIVGVVNDTHYDGLRTEIVPEVYLCSLQQPTPNAQIIYVRTELNPDVVVREIRSAVQQLGPGLPMFNVKTIEREVAESLVTERMIATLSTVFGTLATILAIVGLYGVTAFVVTQRSREIGIRMALGAQRGSVIGLIMREVLLFVIAGALIGLPCAIALSWTVRAQLYGIEPTDSISISIATVLLVGVTVAGAYIPARRAASYQPVDVLRLE
jgi:predicted permease